MQTRWLAAVLMMTLAGACPAEVPVAGAPTTTETPAALDPDAKAALDLLEARGDTLKDYTANILYVVKNAKTLAVEKNGGTTAYVRDNKGNTRVALVLKTLIVDNKIARDDMNHQMLSDGVWVYEKDPDKKIYRKIQIAKPGAAGGADVFGLRGQLPLPIGQKTANVVADFNVEKVPTEEKDPKTAVAIKLTPKKEGMYDFTDLTIVVDTAKDVALPIRISKTSKDESVITTMRMREFKINTGAAAGQVEAIAEPPAGEKWTVDVKPLEEKTP